MIVGITITLFTFMVCATLLIALRMRTMEWIESSITSEISRAFNRVGLEETVYKILLEDGLITGDK